MNGQIPALKAKPEWLPWALQCIRDFNGNYKGIEDCILAKWRKASQRTKSPTARNSLRAVFGPTLRHLQLVMGDADGLQLMSKGKELIDTYDNSGESAFKKALAKHIVKLDKERWGGLIFEIEKLGNSITDKQLLSRLEDKYQSQITMDKLRKVLRFYEYSGLIAIEGENINLRASVLKNLENGLDIKVSESKFLEVLYSEYGRLQKKAAGNPYVSIPDLREAVCQEIGFWPDDFYKFLEEIPKETEDYLIHLSQPMERKLGGIRLGGKYLYYIAIYMKRKEER